MNKNISSFIYQSLLRVAACLALTLCFTLTTWAQDVSVWDGTSATKPSGSGTQDDPYLIQSAANLNYLSANVNKTSNDTYYRQTIDIDLDGKEWTPIGHKAETAFQGHYDGNGHTISNFLITCTSYANYLGYGLFGWVAGSVENLVIDNGRIEFSGANSIDFEKDKDIKVGILAGVLSPSSDKGTAPIVIKNIIVKNSTITDASATEIKAHSFMAGGLTGDINSGNFNGSNETKAPVTISHIYCDVDFDIQHIKSRNNPADNQLHIGGVLGRARWVGTSSLPQNAIYTGSVVANRATVAPVYSFARFASKVPTARNYNNYLHGYLGSFDMSDDYGNVSEALVAKMYYTDYTVNGVSFTDTADETNTFLGDDGTITLKKPESTGFDADNNEMFQGVNRATYLSNTEGTINEFNKVLRVEHGFYWLKEGTSVKMLPYIPDYTVAISQSGAKFVATVTDSENNDASSEFSYKWTDGEGNVLGYTNDPEFAYLYNADKAINVYLCQKNTRTVHIDIATGKSVDATLLAEQNYIFTTTISETLPHTVTITATDKDGGKLPEGTTIVSDHKAGSSVLNTYYEKEFTLPLQGAANSLDVILNYKNANITQSHTLDYIETINATVSLGIPYDVNVNIVTNKGQTALASNIDYVWEVYNSNTIYKSEQVGDVSSTTDFKVPSTLSDNRKLRVKLMSDGVVVTSKDGFSLTQIDPSIITADNRDYQITYNEGYTYTDGFTFDWTASELSKFDGYFISSDKQTFSVNDLAVADRKIKVKITDFYGTTVTKDYTIQKVGLSVAYDAATKTFTATTDIDGASLTWNLVDDRNKTLPNTYLSATGNTAQVTDIAFLDRYVTVTAKEAGADGRTVTVKCDTKISAATLAIKNATPYKAQINGADATAANTTSQDKTVEWECYYADGTMERGTKNSLTFAPNRTMDATYNLLVSDIYGDWKATYTKVADVNLSVNIVRNNDTMTATLSGLPAGYTEADGTWEWRGLTGEVLDNLSTGYTLGNNTNVQTINSTNDNYNVYYAIWKSTDGKLATAGFWTTKNVVYVYDQAKTRSYDATRYASILSSYPDGNDKNHGRTPTHAVKTMKRAYEILAPDTSAVNNIIVVMGYLRDDAYLKMNPDPAYLAKYGTTGNNDNANYIPSGNYGRHATITGSYGEITDGTLKLWGNGENEAVHGIEGATIFRDITFDGGGLQLYFYCNLHDLTMANNVKVKGYKQMKPNENGLPSDGSKGQPHITIVGGMHNYNNESLTYPAGNATDSVTTITILSGCWGRIIGSGRNNGLNQNSNNVFGHPEWPHRVQINVAIKHSTEDESSRYEYSCGAEYDNDIGLLVGGQTDGSIFVDAKMTMLSGRVGRFISGNISFGRKTGDGYPSDGFYGSTELTLEGGEIGELVGGTLGRHDGDSKKTNTCEAYFYGRTILNINGGTINTHIYGAGAGGVVGIGDNDDEGFHTKDKNIPYYTGTTTNEVRDIAYGDYTAAKGKMPTMRLLQTSDRLEVNPKTGERDILDLSKSYTEININGGTINGNVYGGGYGYSKQIKTVALALDQAGDLFGRSYVTIIDGTIRGNVYGGGAGSKSYYNSASAANKPNFSSLANIYGDTYVRINGGIIEGKVFAGSQGVEGLPNMATLYGNTSLIVSDTILSDNTVRKPIINDNIYGGSMLGRIEGNTEVLINGGAIGNNIFGGSEGIATVRNADNTVKTPGTTAYITGDTKLVINNGSYFTATDVANISEANRIAPSNRTFNIYGGGYNNCVIEGSTNVEIYKSLLASYRCLLEPDPNDLSKIRSFEECVNDRTYRKFSVYGGGRGELTDVKKDANLTINIQGGASVPSAKPKDVANNQQFFMIAGGGMAGHVWGDTNVDLDGNIFARRIYGGGMYGNVLGNANMTVRRGAYYGVFGGGLLGNVKGRETVKDDDTTPNEHAINLIIGTKAGFDPTTNTTTDAAVAYEANRNLYIYDNVYGGNDVSGCAGYFTTNQLWNDGTYDSFVSSANAESLTAEQKQHHYLFEHWSERNGGKDYYRHLVRADETKGVNMKIYGGKVLGDVFGAGNGNHTGYYVPNNANSENHTTQDYTTGKITRVMFHEGLPYHYRVNKKDRNSYTSVSSYNSATNTYTGTLRTVLDPKVREQYGLYEYRPRVGKVVMHIGGNSETDRVEISGSVHGGGHACTIGNYDPSRDVLTDPLRFEGGGVLKMNFGSHVTVSNSVYMGSRGRIIGQQTIKGEHDYDGFTLDSDMDYHYYDDTQNKYLLGFPNTKEGRMRFHAYVQLVNMGATTELSFKDQIDNSESTDIRWGNFYAGGARGSMTKKILPETHPEYDATKHKPYEYSLPRGLTVEHRVVGGSEDAEITYYDYKSKKGYEAFTEIDYTKPMFTFYGGIVYDDYTAGHYGGGQVQWHDESYEASADKSDDPIVAEADKMVGDESPRGSLVVMKLNVNCEFDPQKSIAVNDDYNPRGVNPEGEVADDGEQYWGGLVYGGCYNSGITNGSVEVLCTNNLLGPNFSSTDYHDYLAWSSLRRNVGCVYGGGFGENTTILGNTQVTLDRSFRAFNVFGGGMMGDVTGGTEVNVQGSSLIYNAVYGGSMMGDVGKEEYDYDIIENGDTTHVGTDGDLYAKGTQINLISGGVDRVYGGGFMGNVYGGTHINASDEKAILAAEQYNLTVTNDADKTGPTRLLVGSIYGGNDVTGTINKDLNEKIKAADGTTEIDNPAFDKSTYITVSETPSNLKTEANSYYLTHKNEKDGGIYAGYPMIGTIYGAGNGDMADYIKGVIVNHATQTYRDGRIHIANGHGANYRVFDLSQPIDDDNHYTPLPNVESTKIDVTGGTIINLYGGGSMCTATESDEVFVNYADTVARAAYVTNQDDEMTWGVLRLFESLQKEEVTQTLGLTDGKTDLTKNNYTRFSHQIYRVFGGNNMMDMAIQPNLNLQRGYIFSVYSGGNFGRMTYCRDFDPNPAADQPRGLNLTINSSDIHIESIYGGSRVGDIIALDADGNLVVFNDDDPSTDTDEAEYGATLNIFDGLIGDVYGGNNVAGTVYNGTNVNIYGAISGNVYGSGNGNYIYYYDYDDTKSNKAYPGMITEGYDEDYGGRYFILPKKTAYGSVAYGSSPEEKILAINSYRPNVEKAFLNIHGRAPQPAKGTPGEEGYVPAKDASVVYVLGSVFCGGNSSTVLYDPKKTNGNIRFEIGSYVTLGGVFLGSNGEGLASASRIGYLKDLNQLGDLGTANQLASRAGFQFSTPQAVEASPLHFNDKPSYDTDLYPNLLALYMRATEVTALPNNFTLPEDAVEAHIGNFTLGGNFGSMMLDKTINITMPENLIIFGRITGGCYNSRIEYQGATFNGGMIKPLAADQQNKRLNLNIRNKFRPWRMVYSPSGFLPNTINTPAPPEEPRSPKVRLLSDCADENGNYIATKQAGGTYYYTEGRCNIFGGCYTSGRTVGDIQINLYSDMLGLYEQGGWDKVDDSGLQRDLTVNRQMLRNNTTSFRTVFAITGAGFGVNSEVEGNTNIRLMPQDVRSGEEGNYSYASTTHHPSVCTIFGGSHNGQHIGNATIEVRDGMIFSSLYGGSRAAVKYGSSEIIVGYPKYYKVKEGKSGTYTLDRADNISYVAQAALNGGTFLAPNGKTYASQNKDNKGQIVGEVIKQTVKYREGELVPANVVAQMIGFDPTDASATALSSNAEIVAQCFGDPIEFTPADFNSKWDNISINAGDNAKQNDTSAPYYGGGGIYGGGHAINESSMTYSGINTQLAFNAQHKLDDSHVGFGGNSAIMVGDNPENYAMNTEGTQYLYTIGGEGASGATIRDHISIGTGHFVPANIAANGNKIGTYVLETTGPHAGKFTHQAAGAPEAGQTYYRMECEGGIYGDGRRTFVQNFRAVDISGYGYADSNPQYAKLINTFQRIDLLSLNDCCLQLQGTQDYATNSIDATDYSIARVGEIRFNTSIKGDVAQSTADPTSAGNMKLDTPRSRNYMSFFNNVHYIGAMYSNTDFNSGYRGADGKLKPTTGEGAETYLSFKKKMIDELALSKDASLSDEERAEAVSNFNKRNLATAPNMVGINNGYTLKLQNIFTTPAAGGSTGTGTGDESLTAGAAQDNIYYSPVFGVFEVKLLTLAEDEGGGYIYAFNKHEDNTEADPEKTFLEETGNFVYPVAVYTAEDEENNPVENYIIDDCFEQSYESNPKNATDEEVHYWYVKGHKYFYNVTLTGYTYDKNMSFYLNNNDNLLLLSGIRAATEQAAEGGTIRLQSVVWEEHDPENMAADSCALTNNLSKEGQPDSRENYQFYLSIDANTTGTYDLQKDADDNYLNTGTAFVARIPNGNDGYGMNGTAFDYHNGYTWKDTSTDPKTDNTPLLGIRLVDNDVTNNKQGFYEAHLSDPDHVIIVLTAIGEDGKENTYTINLTVEYLKGPTIGGSIDIENCALPGELIHANTGTLTVEMDDAMTITGKKWYLYPKIKKNLDSERLSWDDSDDGRVDVTAYDVNVDGGENRIELPARYYQNDWQLDYKVIVNGHEFSLNNKGDILEIPRINVHNYHRMSTVGENVRNVHDAQHAVSTVGYDLDLDLVGGCIVYIEDDEDFEIFTKYVNYCNGFRTTLADEEKVTGYTYDIRDGIVWQTESSGHEARVLNAKMLPGYNRNGVITGYMNNNTVLGFDDDHSVLFENLKDPSGAEGIRFVLNADITATANTMPISEFRGRFYGNGHVISFGEHFKGNYLIERNYGELHDVGFVSNGGDDTDAGISEEDGGQTYRYTSVIKHNRGRIENCYYYYFPAGHPETLDDYSGTNGRIYSTLVRRNQKTADVAGVVQPFDGQVINCVQNTNKLNANDVHGMRYRENKMFHNGRVAYNLNREYLRARQMSEDNDELVREKIELPDYHATFDGNGNVTHVEYTQGDYLYGYYYEGDYRYGHLNNDPEYPEGLRTTDNYGRPNYEGKFSSTKHTFHITDADRAIDNRRWFEITDKEIIKFDYSGNIEYNADGTPVMTNEGYFPIYRFDSQGELAPHSDFIFFGQRLSNDSERDYYPRRVTQKNRVYRAGGNYGSRTDLGFHFNRDAWALSPELTAIDFTGNADLRDASGKPIYGTGWNYYYYYYYGGGAASADYLNFATDANVEDAGFSTAQEEQILDIVEGKKLRMFCYYPPMLDLPGGPDDHNLHNLEGFNVLSNETVRDHSKVTKNLLVYTPAPDAVAGQFSSADNERLFSSLHYTRMQEWGGTETEQDNLIGHQFYWVSHNADPSIDGHFHAANGLFHLADAQDFNAPIEFVVAADENNPGTVGRAWLKRAPQAYASRNNVIPDENGFQESHDAWESISLPYTCNNIVAVNSIDYYEKYSRGEITHFYGADSDDKSVIFHDYWLRGLVNGGPDKCDDRASDADYVKAVATFARPGEMSDGLFEPMGLNNPEDPSAGTKSEQKWGDYEYYNPWFYNTYKELGYVDQHDAYKEPMTFEKYRYLTKNAPYIVSFPGEDYYEFDLSGEFYNEKLNTNGCHPQEILYEFSVDKIAPNNNFDVQTQSVQIPVTDLYDAVRTTTVNNGTYTLEHNGTFKRILLSDIPASEQELYYVLNPVEIDIPNVHGKRTTYAPGSVFVNMKEFSKKYPTEIRYQEILPFRTYLTVKTVSAGTPAPKYIYLGNFTRSINDALENNDSDDEQTEDLNPETGFKVWVQDNALFIRSAEEMEAPLYTVAGQLYRQIPIHQGTNVYRNIQPGLYILKGHKFVIKRGK